MAATLEIRRRLALAGVVTEEGSGRPVAGARVEVVEHPAVFERRLRYARRSHGPGWDALPARPDRARTGADGAFVLPCLPDGRYQLRAHLPGAGSRVGAGRVEVRVAGGRAEGLVSLLVRPTVVQGRVTALDGTPLALARVRLRGSADTTLTGPDGHYVLPSVEVGSRVVEVSARGHHPGERAVVIPRAGWTVTADLALEAAGP